jgi:ethanolamine ammonia-lyase small subunit
MSDKIDKLETTNDAWAALRRVTQARIGLPRAGSAIATRALLEFQQAHALARDAVWRPWDVQQSERELHAQNITTLRAPSLARDRATFLKRPDLGRSLDPSNLAQLTAAQREPAWDVALILSDGLSATAVHAHGVPTLLAILASLRAAALSCAPVVLAEHGRVALSDEIGEALGARVAVIVLGERPGLSAADSLGLYLTFGPLRGNTDAQRNCISNVRAANGLAPHLAAMRLTALLRRSLALGQSGVALKDDAAQLPDG